MNYGYARVSSADQNLARQLDDFGKCGIVLCNIFSDKSSGKDFQREQYQNLIELLQKGDVVVIKSIDRLGRNYDMILAEWRRITQEIGADIVVLDMPLLDTRTKPDGDKLTGKLISDIVLQLLSYLAQKERDNTNVRQKEGIAAAKRRGVQFGRPAAANDEDIERVLDLYDRGLLSLQQALDLTGLKRSCFYYRYKLYKGDAE